MCSFKILRVQLKDKSDQHILAQTGRQRQVWAPWQESWWIQGSRGAPAAPAGTAPAPTVPGANRWDTGKGQPVGKRKWRRATREEENREEMKPLLWCDSGRMTAGKPSLVWEKRKEKSHKNCFWYRILLLLSAVKSITGTSESSKNNRVLNHPKSARLYLMKPPTTHPCWPGVCCSLLLLPCSCPQPSRGHVSPLPFFGVQVLHQSWTELQHNQAQGLRYPTNGAGKWLGATGLWLPVLEGE